MTEKTRVSRTPGTPDRSVAQDLLNRHWEAVLQDDTLQATSEIAAIVNSSLVTVRYCLPTQLLGKLADRSLDALCLQARNKAPGLWDPRSFAAEVIAPWVLRNQKVLGNSADPYVGNPLRRPRLDQGLDQLSGIEKWTALISVLADVQLRDDPDYTEAVFRQTLTAIRDRMREHDFTYVVPPRISLALAEALVRDFLGERSGGDRGLAVAAALFEAFSDHLNTYQSVRRGVINASDASTGSAADLECVDKEGHVVLAVEVKERRIGQEDVQVAIGKARAADVRELILVTEGVMPAEQSKVDEASAKAWALGTYVYHVTIADMIHNALPVLGERGVLDFVMHVGHQLNQFSTQPRHRRAWKTLLDRI